MQKFLEGGTRHLFWRSANGKRSAQDGAGIGSVNIFVYFVKVDVGGGQNCVKISGVVLFFRYRPVPTLNLGK